MNFITRVCKQLNVGKYTQVSVRERINMKIVPHKIGYISSSRVSTEEISHS